VIPTYQPSHWLGGDHSNQSPRADATVRDVLIAAAIKELDWSWEPGEVEQCLYGEYRIPPSPEECFENVAGAQLAALAEAGYVVVCESDTDEGRAAAQVDPGGKHDEVQERINAARTARLEARGGPHG